MGQRVIPVRGHCAFPEEEEEAAAAAAVASPRPVGGPCACELAVGRSQSLCALRRAAG